MDFILNGSNRLAVIYKVDDNNSRVCNFCCATIVKYNKVNNTFTIENGKYAGYNSTQFNLLEGNPNFIYNNYNLSVKKNYNMCNRLMIYIFNNSFRDEVSDNIKSDISQIIAFEIVKRAMNKELIFSKNSDLNGFIFITKKTEKEKSLNESEVISMLDSNNNSTNRRSNSNIKSSLSSKIPACSTVMADFEDAIIRERKYIFDYRKIDVVNVINSISKRIVGQSEAIKTLVSNIYFNQYLFESLSDLNDDIISNELDSRKVAILLDGTTGTGKTAIIKEISNRFKLPMVIVNANSFSETGYVGPSITEILSDLLKQANGNIDLAQRGIVFLDEVDKIAENNEEDSHSMKLGVQKELLGFMSGAKYDIKIDNKIGSDKNSTLKFNTSKLTFILSGAFTRIKDRKIKNNNKKTVGFNIEYIENDDFTYTMNSDDYIEYGLMKEFFGRIKVIVATKTYNIDDLKTILLESEISPIKGFEKNCIMLGYNGIEYEDDIIDRLAEEAYDMGTGARALQSLVAGMQDVILYDLITNKYDKSKPIPLSMDLLDNYKKRTIRRY